jgi:AraC-like DNA-binding protein
LFTKVSTRKGSQLFDPVDRGKGLFRSLIAGAGHTFTEAFGYLEQRNTVVQFSRHLYRGLLGARMILAPEEGEGYWDFTQIGNDVYVVAGSFAYKDQRVEFVKGDDLLQFYFTLSGDLTMAINRTERVHINRPSLFVYTQPQGVVIKEWTPPGAHQRFVAVVIRPQFLVDHFLGYSFEIPPLVRACIAGTLQRLEYCHLPLNAHMFEIATKFVNNPYTGVVGLIYAEAITLELLCHAIAGLTSLSTVSTEQHSEREIRCLHAARGYLMKQLNPAPTIRQVARIAGINETTLKRGFKAVFGETLFEFSVRCRMQHALMLLRNHRTQVARVAGAVGYRHQTSFATAFRRHFGFSPKDVRRGNLE